MLFVYRRALVEFEGAGVELVVGAVFSHELVVVAAFDDATVVHDHDDVGILDGGESVGDDKDGASVHELVHPILHDGFGAGVDGGGGFVEDHHRWVANRRTGNGEELALALREACAVATENGVVAVRQHFDKAVGIGELGGVDALFIRRLRVAVADVFHDGVSKEVDVLEHDAHGTAQIILFDMGDVDAVVEDGAVANVIEAVDEVGDGGFAGTGGTDKGHFLPRLGVEVDVVENLLIWLIAKVHMFHDHIPEHWAVFGDAFFVHALPCPKTGACVAFFELSACAFAGMHKNDVAFVHFRRFVQQCKDTCCPGKGSNNRIDLAGELGDWHAKVAGQGEEAGNHPNGHDVDAGKGKIWCRRGGKGGANEGNNDKLHIAQAVHDWHHGGGVAVCQARGFAPSHVLFTHVGHGLAFVAKDLHNLEAVDDFFHIAV